MKYVLLILLLVSFFHESGKCQTPKDTMHYWKTPVLAEINFNQAALSNWQGGGQNTIAGAGFIHAAALYKRNAHEWWNKLDAGFGMVRLGDKSQPFQKSDDELKIGSGYARDLSKTLKYIVSMEAKTTFAPGYKYGKDSNGNPVRQEKLSQFMSPAYILFGTGIAYKPNDTFFASFSPLTFRATIIANDSMADAGLYGVPAGHHLRVEVGENIRIGIKMPLMKNMLLETSLDMFGNYKHVLQQVIDWPLTVTFKVNNVFTAKFGTHLIYDQDVQIKRDNGTVGPAVQFKEVIALGLQYKIY